MKIRNGFVSNSSSSSFVVLLPENFLENVEYDKIVEKQDEDFPIEIFKSLVEKFIDDGGMCNEEIYDFLNENQDDNDYDDDDYDDYDFYDILYDLIQPYIIADMEGGPDEGQIIVADINKVKEILA